MNFTAIDQTLDAILSAISGLPVASAQQDNQSQYFPQAGIGAVTDGHGNTLGTADNNEARVTFNYSVIGGIGRDEWRYRYDPTVLQPGDTYAGPGAPLGSTIDSNQGNRELLLQITVECFDLQGGKAAWPIAERIRTAINLPSVRDMLRDNAGLAIQKTGETHATDYDDDNGRCVSVCVFEVRLNASDGVEDIPQTTIEIVEQPTIANGKLTVYGLFNGPTGPGA